MAELMDPKIHNVHIAAHSWQIDQAGVPLATI